MYVFLFTFYLILFWTLVDFDFGYVDKNINSWIIPKKKECSFFLCLTEFFFYINNVFANDIMVSNLLQDFFLFISF